MTKLKGRLIKNGMPIIAPVTNTLTRDLKYELMRKTIHFCSVIFPLSLLIFDNDFPYYFIYGTTVFFILFDILRLYSRWFRKQVLSRFGRMIRMKEQNKFLGSSTMMIAESFLITFFDNKILIVCSIMFLIFGDSIAAVFGKTFGRIKIFKGKGHEKSLEGSFAFFLMCSLIAYLFGGQYYLFVGGLAATIIELIPTNIDDNLSIPIFSMIVMELCIFLW